MSEPSFVQTDQQALLILDSTATRYNRSHLSEQPTSNMAQNSFDQLSKQYLEEFLAPIGTVQRQYEVLGEAKFVDVVRFVAR